MPGAKPSSGKQTLGARKKSEEVAEKVKEIKRRQRNWMKQREQQISSTVEKNPQPDFEKRRSLTRDCDRTKQASVPSVRHKTTESKRTNIDHNINVHKTPTSDASNVRGKFQNWLKVRHETNIEDTDIKDDTEPLHNYGLPDDFSDEDRSESEVRSQLLAPEEFDDLADRIILKAQKELYDHKTNRTEMPLGIMNEDTAVNMSSHRCTNCSALMIGSKYTPMLLIPCGHTMCRECCQDRRVCPGCYSQIASATCNIMLQQIIQEYQGKQGAAKTNIHRSEHQYIPKDYQEKLHKRDSTSTGSRQQYLEQLCNLQTRLDVLSEEKSSIRLEYDQLTDSIQKESQQLRNVSKQEENIACQITTLQEKLQILHQHKIGYESRCSELQSIRTDSQTRLTMLNDTMQSLCNQIEKVKMLSEA